MSFTISIPTWSKILAMTALAYTYICGLIPVEYNIWVGVVAYWWGFVFCMRWMWRNDFSNLLEPNLEKMEKAISIYGSIYERNDDGEYYVRSSIAQFNDKNHHWVYGHIWFFPFGLIFSVIWPISFALCLIYNWFCLTMRFVTFNNSNRMGD